LREAPVNGDYDGRQYVGIDLHRRRSVIVRMTAEGEPHTLDAPLFPAAASIAPSSPASRPFVLAALRALRLDPDCGDARPEPPRNHRKTDTTGSTPT
jgi:hypothetical protein